MNEVVLSARRSYAVAAEPAWPRDPVWWLSLASLTGFVLATKIGNLGMAICLGTWAFYVAAQPIRALPWLKTYWLPWLLPVFAMSSAFWSIEPMISFKLGLEFVVFTGVAIVAARAQSLRSLVSTFMCALLIGLALSAALRTTAPVGNTGEIALIGIFGSKNNLASFACLSMICSIPVLADTRQPRILRCLAVLGLLLDPVMLVKAHSLGALLAGGVAIMTSTGVIVLSWLSPRERNLLVPLTGIMLLGLAIVAIIALRSGFDISTVLASAGKDTSLTGRTFLWSRAREYIAMRPVLGLGYQSFWVQGHVEAEGLWRYAQIESRMGFHFHNLYYETAVELGELGVTLLAVTLVTIGARVLALSLCQPEAPLAFFSGLVSFYAMRLFVELDFLDPFSPGSLLLPVMWVYVSTRRLAGPNGT